MHLLTQYRKVLHAHALTPSRPYSRGTKVSSLLPPAPPCPLRFLQTFGVGGATESNPLLNKYYIPIPGLNSTSFRIPLALCVKSVARTPRGLHENSTRHTPIRKHMWSSNLAPPSPCPSWPSSFLTFALPCPRASLPFFAFAHSCPCRCSSLPLPVPSLALALAVHCSGPCSVLALALPHLVAGAFASVTTFFGNVSFL